ncbi:MAG: hypothetical protein WC179_08800 [Candidatus Cloacimonadaceae bacterium]
MIELEVKYKNNKATVRQFNEWDIENKEDIVDPLIIKVESQKDKYVLLNDGWGLYARILSKTTKSFVTETGVVKRGDYCRFSRVQYPYTNYSGAKSYDEHKLSRPYRRQEYLVAGKFLKTNHKITLTPRIKMCIQERIQRTLSDRGIDVEWVTDRLIREADLMKNRGADRIEAVKLLSRLSGVELEKQTGPTITMNQPLFQQFNAGTIQNQRRQIPSKKELNQQIELAGTRNNSKVIDTDFEVVSGERRTSMNPKKLKPKKTKIVEDGVYSDDD